MKLFLVFCDGRIEKHSAFYGIVAVDFKKGEIVTIKDCLNPKSSIFKVEKKAVLTALKIFPQADFVLTDNYWVKESFIKNKELYKKVLLIKRDYNPADYILREKFFPKGRFQVRTDHEKNIILKNRIKAFLEDFEIKSVFFLI